MRRTPKLSSLILLYNISWKCILGKLTNKNALLHKDFQCQFCKSFNDDFYQLSLNRV